MTNDLSLNRKSKDSVFVKFFSYIKNVKQLYEEFHPEITDLTEDDIQIQTLDSAIVNTIYNDLGFIVKDKFVMLVEAQSSWNPNIALRMLFYLNETFRRYLTDTKQSEHSNSKVKLPTPEMYVIYTGDGVKPETVSLSEEFFDGNPDIELRVKVLSQINTTLAGQYIGFCKVFDTQRKLYENGILAAKETYRICIEKGYLIEFMKDHEKEVIDMMTQLFDEETMRKQYDIASRRESLEQGIKIGEERGLKLGEERGLKLGEERGLKLGEERGLKLGEERTKLSLASALITKGIMSLDEISQITGLPLEKIKTLTMS